MKKEQNKVKGDQQNKTNIEELETSIKSLCDQIDGFVYPLIIPPLQSIDEDILFEIYPHLLKIGKQERLNVLLYSYGGDAHTAFHVGRLLQEYSNDLKIFILREAKSAATLISCSADEIVFTGISELGPMDPQIKRSDLPSRFSPLAIKHVFDLLEEESKAGHAHIVTSLTQKLPDPLILGEHLKSLETGKDYIQKLLSSRMFADKTEEAKCVGEKLVTGYPDHVYCIDLIEAQSIGLKAVKNEASLDNILINIMQFYKNVWAEFERNFKSEEKESKDIAFKTYVGLKQLASNIVNYQINKNKPKK